MVLGQQGYLYRKNKYTFAMLHTKDKKINSDRMEIEMFKSRQQSF